MHSCNDCPDRDSCTSICPEVEKLLPPVNGGTDSHLTKIDRQIVWSVQDIEDDLSPEDRLIARLYHRLGLEQREIARIIRHDQSRVSRILKRIRKKVAGK